MHVLITCEPLHSSFIIDILLLRGTDSQYSFRNVKSTLELFAGPVFCES